MGNGKLSKAEWVQAALEQYSGPLTRYAARITGDLEQARDVVQDTFLRLCAAEHSKVDDHLGPWLFTVCRNRAFDVRRKESRMSLVKAAQRETCADAAPPPSFAVEQRETHSAVLRIIDSLPEKQQEVVRLKFQNEMSYKEISAITGCTVSNVGFLIHTAIKTIRQRLQAESEQAREA